MLTKGQEIVMLARPRRSVLYMPGSNAKALAKAATLPADALILDLEDSVAPDAKEAARAQVVEAARGDFGGREVVIRVNGSHTPWGPADIIAGVYNDINDLGGFRAECLQGRDMGLDGKTLVHPTQIDICNEVFAPTQAEVENARAILDAFARPENQGRGAIQLNGRMVEL